MHRTIISFVQPQPNSIQNNNNPIGCGTAPGNLVSISKSITFRMQPELVHPGMNQLFLCQDMVEIVSPGDNKNHNHKCKEVGICQLVEYRQLHIVSTILN